jgi:hypothetical protein
MTCEHMVWQYKTAFDMIIQVNRWHDNSKQYMALQYKIIYDMRVQNMTCEHMTWQYKTSFDMIIIRKTDGMTIQNIYKASRGMTAEDMI